jgi:2-amino-4-hydroxy-6-hydroxymethyldihydropteridine diphosphokinase
VARVYIGIGSNIDPAQNIRKALDLLRRQVDVRGISTFYRTDPIGRPEQPCFYNGVVAIETSIPPHELKYSVLRRIEDELGRNRGTDKYAARTIDMDILTYDNMVCTSDLVLPDPEITHRAFLAIPLCELAPDLVLPGTGLKIRDVAASLGCEDVTPLPEFTELLQKDLLHEP